MWIYNILLTLVWYNCQWGVMQVNLTLLDLPIIGKGGYFMGRLVKVLMCAGSVKKTMFSGLSYKDAMSICEGYGWVVSPDGDGGFEWDLEIDYDD